MEVHRPIEGTMTISEAKSSGLGPRLRLTKVFGFPRADLISH